MNQQNNSVLKMELIEVRGDELQFIRKNAPTAFARTVSEALIADGYQIDRVTVHKELHTIKDGYDPIIITKSRELLKVLSKVEFSTSSNSQDLTK